MKHQPPKPFKPSNLQTYPIKVLKEKKQEVLNEYERLMKMALCEKRYDPNQTKHAIEFNKKLNKDKNKIYQIIKQLEQSINMLEAINNNKF